MIIYVIFFFNDTATTEIYTLSLHDALPIFALAGAAALSHDLWVNVVRDGEAPEREQLRVARVATVVMGALAIILDRKSTRLNSSHANISYAVFCLKKKKTTL